MADAGQWFKQLPRFTRYWLAGTITMSLLTRFGILPLQHMYLARDLVLTKLHLWRCVTSLFVYPLTPSTGFHFLINCYFITQYSARLEKDQFGRSPADYLYLQLIVSSLAVLGGLLFNVAFLMDLLVVAITYIWCQLNKDVVVNFWFGSRFKAIYLPWVLAGMELIFQGWVEQASRSAVPKSVLNFYCFSLQFHCLTDRHFHWTLLLFPQIPISTRVGRQRIPWDSKHTVSRNIYVAINDQVFFWHAYFLLSLQQTIRSRYIWWC